MLVAASGTVWVKATARQQAQTRVVDLERKAQPVADEKTVETLSDIGMIGPQNLPSNCQ